jgi:N-acetyl-gamma-glutamyl-phosphate reductase
MPARLQPAVCGATGYSGFELVRLLARHAGVKKPLLLRRNGESGECRDLSDAYPQLSGNGGFPFESFSWHRMKEAGVDVMLLATPHQFSRQIVPEAISHGYRVIDLSGAWRLKQEANRALYGFAPAQEPESQLDDSAVYGLPELHADAIRQSALLANPGCYATSIILALTPWIRCGFVDLQHGIVCDSKSGVSGAGKQPTPKTHFVEVEGDFSAYNVFGHRHTGEILEQLGLESAGLQFTPHLLPIPRGILSTIYLKLAKPATADDLEQALRQFYAGKPWVRIFGAARLPQIKFSVNTNYCDIGFALSPDGTRVVLVSCLDNLLKGAAGQAVQNLNLMFGFDEKEGLQ